MPNDLHTRPKKNNEKRNFYIALSVCLLAAAAAAFSTYISVMDYVQTNRAVLAGESAVSSAVSASGRPVSSLPEEPKPQSREPVSSANEAESSVPDLPTAAEASEEAEPVAYLVSSHFLPPVLGKTQLPYSGDTLVYNETMRDWRTHPGCDIACEEGESVTACANGRVKQIYTHPHWGNVVEVEHGDYTLRYCGVSEDVLVQTGEIVRQGQVLALVTAVPCEATYAPHLHLEAECGGEPVDPMELFS
ncbi:MAG: M23 family metallopeptidase [Clostridia bacterium]|nr:M23 family metallopeptidase [Clostridia bacterium]